MGTINTTNGATIRSSLAESIGDMNKRLAALAKDDVLPVETKRNRRLAIIQVLNETVNEANAAFSEWSAKEREEAQTALKQRPIGSAAEESRRVADELRLNRLIESSRRSGTPMIAARDLAGQASAAYLDARDESGYREAALLARAAIEVGGATSPSAARNVLDAAEKQMETAEQKYARKTLATLDVEALAYRRDQAALMASALSSASEAAAATKDTMSDEYRRHAARQSATAKMMEFSLAQASGRDYVEPSGTMSGVPTNEKPDAGPRIEYGRSGDGRLAVLD